MIQAHISQSLEGLELGLIEKYGLMPYVDYKDECVFFGMYREEDFNKIILQHPSRSAIVWFGSDALNLPFEWTDYIKQTTNIAVSKQVQATLQEKGIYSIYRPINAVIPSYYANVQNGDNLFWYYGNAPEFKEYGKWYYQAWHNELYSFKLWLQDIVLLQRYLESINKPYVMINADNNCLDRWNVDWPRFNSSVKSLLCFDLMHDDQLLQEHAEIQSLLSQINTDNYVGWNQWWLATACKIHPVGPTGHSLADGHQYIADYIQKHDSYSRPHC
jgi:hypothetical protein